MAILPTRRQKNARFSCRLPYVENKNGQPLAQFCGASTRMAEDKKPSGANFEQPVAVQLDEKVAQQRTTELATLVDNIPGLVAIMAAGGAVEFVKERVREYFG